MLDMSLFNEKRWNMRMKVWFTVQLTNLVAHSVTQ